MNKFKIGSVAVLACVLAYLGIVKMRQRDDSKHSNEISAAREKSVTPNVGVNVPSDESASNMIQNSGMNGKEITGPSQNSAPNNPSTRTVDTDPKRLESPVTEHSAPSTAKYLDQPNVTSSNAAITTQQGTARTDAHRPDSTESTTTKVANTSATTPAGTANTATAGRVVATTPATTNSANKISPHAGHDPVSPPKPEKQPPNFPGIQQEVGELMVSRVKVLPGEGTDQVIVELSVTEGNRPHTGTVWVIGEYIQRGTTGIMFMPSHQDLKLSPEGKPANTRTGTPYEVSSSVTKKFTITRPGFDGEELQGIRVGFTDETGKSRIAKISTQQIAKKQNIKRAKVNAP